jgi:uncharacterized protein YjbI with pentapeptide repeats
MRNELEYIENENFEGVKEIKIAEYEGCVFKNCMFHEADFSKFTFSDCEFIDCDLSMAKLNDCSFKDVQFVKCKLLGLRFEDCNAFLLKIRFETCLLNMASFYQMKLPGQVFIDCILHECDFTETDLSKGYFSGSDLSGAIFDHTNLLRANLQGANNFSINPIQNNVKKARFSKEGLMGLLDFSGIIVD